MKKLNLALITLVILIICNVNGFAQFTKEQLEKISPNDAFALLQDGNQRFINDTPINRNWAEEVKGASPGQYPFAVILSCMDSRVPAEIVFDQGIGDIFVNRVAGNIINDDILGSMEYGCGVVGSKVILVLGHTECGAVKGAIDNVELGNLTGLLDKIEPAIAVTKYDGNRSSSDKKFVELVTEENVRVAMNEIRSKSSILKNLESEGKVKIVGGLYDVSTGKVNFFE